MNDAIENESQQDVQPQEPEKKHEPPVDSPRWNEVYGKWKEAERQIEALTARDAERENNMMLMQAHNKALADTLSSVEEKFQDVSKPNRDEDPEAYEKWFEDKVRREVKKDVAQQPRIPFIPRPQQAQPTLPIEEVEFAAKNPDYWETIAKVNAELLRNPTILDQFRSTTNAFEAAYRYQKAKDNAVIEQRQSIENQGFVEGGSPQPKGSPVELSPEEKNTAAALGISVDDYAKQKKFIESRGW